MRLRYIELFHAILTTGSLTGAAKLLHISQPAASKSLQHAEAQLGFALFSRVRGRLQPTREALLLRQRVEGIIHDVHDLERLTSTLAEPAQRPLRILCTPTLAQDLLPGAIMRLRKAFPDSTVELATRHSAVMREALTLHEADIGLSLQDVGNHALHSKVLGRGRVMVIAPAGTWPADQLTEPLPLTALAGQPMIGIVTQDALGNVLQGPLARITPAPRIAIQVQTYPLARSLVARGAGFALVDPFTACHDPLGQIQRRPLGLKLEVALHALHRHDDPLDPVQEQLLALVQQQARHLLHGAAQPDG